jgi:iron complex transport system ATP-binding protein
VIRKPVIFDSEWAMQARAVSVNLGTNLVLRDINLNIAAGKWTSVLGPNGAGKSTLLRVLAGLQSHVGEVHLMGKNLIEMPRRMRARQLSWLGQNETAGEDLSVFDVVMLGRLPHQDWLAAPSAADHAAVENALRSTHAWEWRARYLGQLSGGERQRVLLARALAVDAQVMLMDEPLVNLDPPHQADWLTLVRELVKQGKTVVSVLHEISFALHADQMVIVAAGRIQHQGACADPITHRALESVFDQRVVIRELDGQFVALPKI